MRAVDLGRPFDGGCDMTSRFGLFCAEPASVGEARESSLADRQSPRGPMGCEGEWVRPCGFGCARGIRLRSKEGGKTDLRFGVVRVWRRSSSRLAPGRFRPSRTSALQILRSMTLRRREEEGRVGFARPASAGSGVVASAAAKEAATQGGCETLSLRSIEECFKGEKGLKARFGCSQRNTGLRGEQDFEVDGRFRALVIGEFGDARRSGLANSGLARWEAESWSRASDEGERSQRPEEDRLRVLSTCFGKAFSRERGPGVRGRGTKAIVRRF
jgi:hypothetical protein